MINMNTKHTNKNAKNVNNIGMDVEYPKDVCDDNNCPFHGSIKLRGRVFKGKVVSDKMNKTIVVEWERRFYIPKYERFEKRWTKVKAHNPSCINAKTGDFVLLAETRPISKTKHFVVIQKTWNS